MWHPAPPGLPVRGQPLRQCRPKGPRVPSRQEEIAKSNDCTVPAPARRPAPSCQEVSIPKASPHFGHVQHLLITIPTCVNALAGSPQAGFKLEEVHPFRRTVAAENCAESP